NNRIRLKKLSIFSGEGKMSWTLPVTCTQASLDRLAFVDYDGRIVFKRHIFHFGAFILNLQMRVRSVQCDIRQPDANWFLVFRVQISGLTYVHCGDHFGVVQQAYALLRLPEKSIVSESGVILIPKEGCHLD